jgi:putative inorganic carbon (hco3(-)) transporter
MATRTQLTWQLARLLLPLFVLLTAVAAGLLVVQAPSLAIGAILTAVVALALLYMGNAGDLATLAVIFILYTNLAVIAVRFHGVPSLLAAAFPLLLLIPLVRYLLVQRQKLVITPVLLLLALFVVVQLLGAIFARNVAEAAGNIMTFALEVLLIYFLLTNVVRTPETLRRVVWVLLIAGLLLGGVPLYQQITGTFDNTYGGYAQLGTGSFRTGEETIEGEVRQQRSAGAIGEQNRYAQVMLMLLPLALFRFWGERSTALRLLALVAAAVVAAGVALAFSRGAAVGFVLMLLIMVFLGNIKVYQLAGFLLASILLLVAIPQYSARLISIPNAIALFSDSEVSSEEAQPDGAIRGRATSMIAAALVFADHPVLGVGPGMFRYYSREYGNPLGLRFLEGDREAHSLYLGLAADHGLLGLLIFLAILYLTLRGLNRARLRWAQAQPLLASLTTSFFLALIAYMTTGIFLHLAYARYFGLILGLAGAAAHMAGEGYLPVTRNEKARIEALGAEENPLSAPATPQAEEAAYGRSG